MKPTTNITSTLKSFKTLGSQTLVAAALTLNQYLSPNEKAHKEAVEMQEVEPQELPDQWEELMDAYCNPDHPQNAFATRVMEATRESDPAAHQIQCKAFFSTVAGKPSKSGTGGRKWWDKSDPVDDVAADIQATIDKSREEHRLKAEAKDIENAIVRSEHELCDYCLDRAESTTWQSVEAHYYCPDCGAVFCSDHADPLYLDHGTPLDPQCFYCGNELEEIE